MLDLDHQNDDEQENASKIEEVLKKFEQIETKYGNIKIQSSEKK